MTWVLGECKGEVRSDRKLAHKDGCRGDFG